jgi:hypothetical protein
VCVLVRDGCSFIATEVTFDCTPGCGRHAEEVGHLSRVCFDSPWQQILGLILELFPACFCSLEFWNSPPHISSSLAHILFLGIMASTMNHANTKAEVIEAFRVFDREGMNLSCCRVSGEVSERVSCLWMSSVSRCMCVLFVSDCRDCM